MKNIVLYMNSKDGNGSPVVMIDGVQFCVSTCSYVYATKSDTVGSDINSLILSGFFEGDTKLSVITYNSDHDVMTINGEVLS